MRKKTDLMTDNRSFRNLPEPIKRMLNDTYADYLAQPVDMAARTKHQQRLDRIGRIGVQTIIDAFEQPLEQLEKRQDLPARSYKAITRRLGEILLEHEHAR